MVRSNHASIVAFPRWRIGLISGVAAIACGCTWLAACQTTASGEDSHAEKEYRTGSNIAVKDRNAPSDAKTYDPNSVQDAARSALPRPPVGLKGG